MKISKQVRMEIMDVAQEPFVEDRVIKVTNLLRKYYNMGVHDILVERANTVKETSDIRNKIIEGLLGGCEVIIKPKLDSLKVKSDERSYHNDDGIEEYKDDDNPKLKTGEIGHLYGVRFVESKKVKDDEIRVSGGSESVKE